MRDIETLLNENMGSYVELDECVGLKLDSDGCLWVSFLDTEEAPDDGNAESIAEKHGVLFSLSGNGSGEGEDYIEMIKSDYWRLKKYDEVLKKIDAEIKRIGFNWREDIQDSCFNARHFGNGIFEISDSEYNCCGTGEEFLTALASLPDGLGYSKDFESAQEQVWAAIER